MAKPSVLFVWSGYSTAQATASTYSQASSNKMGQASTNTKASAKDYADIEEANTTAASTTADDGNGFGGGR